MKNNSLQYSMDDIIRSFRWLNHKHYGFTELAAFHPDYKPGRENFEYILKQDYLPKTWYVKYEKQLIAFISKYHAEHICCYGVNPRPRVLKKQRGYIRSARDADIKTVMNFYLDFDLVNPGLSGMDWLSLEELFSEIDFYLGKLKIKPPVRAFTGKGYHLVFALPPLSVNDHPDITDRLKKFRHIINDEFSMQIKEDHIKLDNTLDLRRVAKIYGTKKPKANAKLSQFHGNQRIEDYVLKEYLLSLNLNDDYKEQTNLNVPEKLPAKFLDILKTDNSIRQLWNNHGKQNNYDDSRSGYDYSLVKACLRSGITDINDLISILALRPEGAFQKSNKNEKYIRRTIANAIYK